MRRPTPTNAPSALAASLAVCATACFGSLTARCGGRAERRASRRTEASADRHVEGRRLTPLQISRFPTRDLGEVCSRRASHCENRPLRQRPNRPLCRTSPSSLQRRSSRDRKTLLFSRHGFGGTLQPTPYPNQCFMVVLMFVTFDATSVRCGTSPGIK